VPWSVLVSGVASGGKGKGTSSSGLRSVNFGWTDISKVSDTEKCLLPQFVRSAKSTSFPCRRLV
jgi:hypothetical protein